MQTTMRATHNGAKKTTHRTKKILKRIELVNPTVIPIPGPAVIHTKRGFTLIWDNQLSTDVQVVFDSVDAVEGPSSFLVGKGKGHKNKAKKQAAPPDVPTSYDYSVTSVGSSEPEKKSLVRSEPEMRPPTIIIW